MLTTASAGQVDYSSAVDVFSFGVVLWQVRPPSVWAAERVAAHARVTAQRVTGERRTT